MISITKKYTTETGHRLMDCSGKCAHLHGHRYEWEITVARRTEVGSQLDEWGMVIDSSDLKSAMKVVLEPFDHAMVLSHKDPLVLGHTEEQLKTLFIATNGKEPRLIILPVNPTAENLAIFIADRLKKELPGVMLLEQIVLHETANSCAIWKNDWQNNF